MRSLSFLLLFGTLTSAYAQQPGRSQDGFYSGQTTGQSNSPSNGRVDGRANRNEGQPPEVGDAVKQENNRSAPSSNNAESMDAIVRPGLQR